MNVPNTLNLDNYVVIRSVVVHGILAGDSDLLSASRELQDGRSNVWSCAAQARSTPVPGGTFSRCYAVL